jgi:glycosyltransferase involved in cell wall biosynthesis
MTMWQPTAMACSSNIAPHGRNAKRTGELPTTFSPNSEHMQDTVKPERPSILHLVVNYPDGCSPGPKSKAVKHLIDAATDMDHVVVSLTRRLLPWRESAEWHGNVLVLQYFALPYAVLHRPFMARVARKVAQALRGHKREFDLLHAHKITVEGVIAGYLDIAAGVPRIYSMRPLTDFRLLQRKRGLRRHTARLLDGVAAMMALAPWAERKLVEIYSRSFGGERAYIPNAVVHAPPLGEIASTASEQRFVIAFRADQYRQKRFVNVLKALHALPDRYRHIGLDVYGGGDQSVLQRFVRQQRLDDRVRLLGPLDNAALLKRFGDYLGFVMPSHLETFGMVFAEALCSGIPIVYGKDSGIDGYFPPDDIGAAVGTNDVPALTAAMVRLVDDNDRYRARVRQLREQGRFDMFLPEHIQSAYGDLVMRVLDRSRSSDKG